MPEEIKKKIDEIKAGYKDGTFDPFIGPIVDNAGKERLAAGAMADQDWKDKVDFYVKGVDGTDSHRQISRGAPAARAAAAELSPAAFFVACSEWVRDPRRYHHRVGGCRSPLPPSRRRHGRWRPFT